MITEDYVSFETAKLLKEKGFDEMTELAYGLEHGHIRNDLPISYWRNSEIGEYKFSCPTLQMAMRWLRKEHNLHIITIPYAPMDRHPYHPGEADVVYIAQLFKGIIPIDEIGRSIIKLTPEEACEAAIKYCLENLI